MNLTSAGLACAARVSLWVCGQRKRCPHTHGNKNQHRFD
jgi:hypothetical protein